MFLIVLLFFIKDIFILKQILYINCTINIYTHIYVCACARVCGVCVCVCVCVYVCVFTSLIYIYYNL